MLKNLIDDIKYAFEPFLDKFDYKLIESNELKLVSRKSVLKFLNSSSNVELKSDSIKFADHLYPVKLIDTHKVDEIKIISNIGLYDSKEVELDFLDTINRLNILVTNFKILVYYKYVDTKVSYSFKDSSNSEVFKSRGLIIVFQIINKNINQLLPYNGLKIGIYENPAPTKRDVEIGKFLKNGKVKMKDHVNIDGAGLFTGYYNFSSYSVLKYMESNGYTFKN